MNHPNSKLYIIGNGFDLHHKLDTWYSSFGLFLKYNHEEIYDILMEYYGFEDLDEEDEESLKDPMWYQFEASLAEIDGDLLLDNHTEYAADYSSDDYRDRDLYDIQIYIEDIVNKATLRMREAFEEFINNIDFPDIEDNDLVNIDRKAFFLNFNYTETLEYYYNIPRQNIVYIHNKAGENNPLILGHGIDPKEFVKQEELPPEDPEEYERWAEWMSEQYDYSIERGKEEVMLYFKKSFKPTHEVIQQKEEFFNKLEQINTVYILGHSLSEVDLPYFREMTKYLSEDVEWIVSYFRESEKEYKKEVLKSIGIQESKIHLITISEL